MTIIFFTYNIQLLIIIIEDYIKINLIIKLINFK